ncbi:MAG: carbon storage regulator [Planctomyces sp.]
MLVLSRKISDVIVVGSSGANLGEVRIVVLGVNNGRVKLGIEAPPGVSVHREEVTLRSRMTESLEKVL